MVPPLIYGILSQDWILLPLSVAKGFVPSMLSFHAKRNRVGLRSQVTRVVVAVLLGSLLLPLVGITTPQTLPTANAAVSNGSIALSSGGAGRISFATAIPSSQGLTMEAWIRFTTIASANSIFASCANVAATDNCPTWFQETHLYYLNTGKFRIQMPGGPSWCEVNTGRTINANRWTHFALVVPAQTVNQSTTVTVYVNGRSAGTCTGTPTGTGGSYRGVVIGGSGNSATPNQINIGPTRISKIARYSTSFTAPQTFPTSGDADTWAVTNTSFDTDNASSCTTLSDPNNKTLTFTTFASYQLNNFMTAPTGGGRGGDGTATVTCSSSAPPPLIVSCSVNGFIQVDSAISTTNVGCSGSVDLSSSGITTLSGTFSGATNVTVVKLPNTLQVISNNAFKNTGILRLVLPPSVTSISDEAIHSNSILTTIEMSGSPSVPVTFGSRAFGMNPQLRRVSFGYSADTSLNFGSYSSGNFLFDGNPNLTTINSCAAPDSSLAIFLAGDNAQDSATPKRKNVFNGTSTPSVACDSGGPAISGGGSTVSGEWHTIRNFTATYSGTSVTLSTTGINSSPVSVVARRIAMSTDNRNFTDVCYQNVTTYAGFSCTASGLTIGETYWFSLTFFGNNGYNSTYSPNIIVTLPPASSLATLSNLVLSSGTLSPSFASATENYTADVANSVASGYSVIPTKSDSNATTVQYLGATGTAPFSGALAVGPNIIRTVVTAQDGTTRKTYTVTVTRAGSSVATLSALALSSGTLSPTFASGTTNYTASVGNGVSTITVTPTRADANASTVQYLGATGTDLFTGALAVGANIIRTVVTAQDGTTTSTYTVTVTRAASSVATLSALALSSGTLSPTFASGTTSYSTTVANSVATDYTVTPTKTDSNATTVQYLGATGTTVFTGALAVGPNVIRTVVTAQDGTSTSTYTVTVTRTGSNIATLSGLALSSGTLSPTFASGTTSYTTTVANSVATDYTVTPTKTDSNATTIQYLGATGTNLFTGALAVGANIIRTVVTAQDGITTSTYTVTVTRAASSDATLSALSLSTGTLSPTFTSGTTSYTATVANSVTSITVMPTRTQANATITVNGTSVNSGSASGAISLTVGSNTITVIVTAQDGTTSTYTVSVTRLAIIINTANVTITAPAVGAAPQTSTTSNGQFTTTITWSDSPTTFAPSTAYTATVTVVPNAGYTLTGVSANFFTLNSNAATSGNLANSGVFTYEFPATASAPTITSLNQTLPNYGTTVVVTGTNLVGATVVKIGNTPVASFTVISATSLSFVVNSVCCTTSTISITTPGGTVTSVATITPQPQLAVIATQPVAVSKNVGQSVTFSVSVTAPLDGGVLSYQWIKGSTPIQGATSATLTFTATALTQAGDYYVAVYNNLGGSTSLVASNTATLTLNKATPVLSAFAAVNKTFGDTSFSITAPTSSVPGGFTYQSGTTSVATVNGSTITIVGQGSSVITATFIPENTDDYVSNGTITMTLTVAARQLATPTVPTVVVTQATLKSFTVSWTAVSNAVAYSLRIYANDGVTLLRTVSSLSGTSKLVTATDFPAIADGTTYKVGLVATGDANNTDSALSALASVTTNSQYTITYNTTNSTGGTAPAAATFITGSTPYLISANTGNLVRTAFSFSGWNTAADGTGTTYLATGSVSVSPTANLVLHPRWVGLKFTVTYYGNNNTGGTAPTDSAEYSNGASVTVLGFGTLVRRGYNFAGWTTDALNTSPVISASSTRTINLANLQLYAKWETVPYTVRYNTQGGSTVSNGSYTVGGSITLPATPTRAGHTFNGWFANSTGGTALGSTYSPPSTVTNWSLIYQTTQPYRTSGAYVYSNGYGLGNTDAAKILMNAGRTFNKVRYRMETTYNGVAYYADVSFDKWSASTIDKLAIPVSLADAVQTNVTGCVIDSNWPGFTNVASSVTKGTGKTCRLEVWFDNYGYGSNSSHDEFDAPSAAGEYGSFQVHNVTSGEVQTVLAWNNHGSVSNTPDLGFGSRVSTIGPDWTFAGKTNFDLATWKLQIYIDDAATAPTEPTIGNIDLYAQWTPIQYTVTYNGNLSVGGTAPVNSATYTVGSSIPVVGNTGALTKTGYTFSDWALNSQGTGTIYGAGSSLPVGTSNVTLYARWIATPYSVTYNTTSSTGGSAPTDTTTYTIGQNVPVRGNLGSLVRTGYTFGGWTDNPEGTGTVYQSANNYVVGATNISFHPKWTPNNYTITYNKNGASGLPTASTATYTTGGDAVTLTSVGTMAKTGFNFGGWSTTATGSAISGAYTTTADVTLYAVWTIKSLTVTYSEGSATRANLSGFPANTSGNYGTTITLNATVSATTVIDSAQHAFMGWSDGSSVYQGGSTYLLGETSPTFTALWAKIFAVRYTFNGGTPAAGTSDTDSECLAAGSTCTDGQVITANAAPTRTGYTFAGWVDQNNVAVSGSTFTVASNRYLLYATWTPVDYAITYNTAGGSTAPATFTRQLGQSFTVAAAPTKTGHTFTGWNDGTTVVNPGVTYNVSTSPITLTAQWTTNVYTVSYDANGGSGTAIASVSYTYGASAISLPSAGDLTRTNFTFAGWSETPSGTALTGSYTPTISRTLYVVWTVSQYLVTYSGNGGTPSVASATYTAASTPLVLPTATRANFTLQGWYSAATDGVLLGAAGANYAPASATTIYARWIQDSLVGVPASSLSFISSYAVNPAITATNTFSTADSAISLRVPAGSLPAGTTVTNWLLSTDEYARALLPGQNNYLLSLVVSWLNVDGTVPVAPNSNPLVMTITNSSIKAGARVYSIVGTRTELLGVATQDGSVSVNLTTDPQIYVLQAKPSAPTNVTATSGEQSSSFVSWTASADDGGSAIINYTVTASDGQRCISSTTSCNFGGLTNGTRYTFTVYASNGVGNSDQSTASASITPGDAPAVVIPTNPGTATPEVTTPVTPVPVRAVFVKAQVPPQIRKTADKLICTPGTYNTGFTLDGVIEQGSTSVFTPVSYIYNLLFNQIIQRSLSVTTTKSEASWDLKLAPAGTLVTCSVTATGNSLTVTESSIQNTAATNAALVAQKQSISSAEAEYKAALSANAKNYQKVLVDNRTKWRADIAKNKATYDAELARIKKLSASKSKTALTSAALKTYMATQKKITADYKDSGPAAMKARDLASKTALDTRNAAVAKANSVYGSFIESIGSGVLVP